MRRAQTCYGSIDEFSNFRTSFMYLALQILSTNPIQLSDSIKIFHFNLKLSFHFIMRKAPFILFYT